jgi:hypothetical protein
MRPRTVLKPHTLVLFTLAALIGAVPVSAKGKAALRHHRRLALTVKITLTPVHGAAVTVTRGVVVHA